MAESRQKSDLISDIKEVQMKLFFRLENNEITQDIHAAIMNPAKTGLIFVKPF